MADVIDEFVGRLYHKSMLEKWNLPEKTKQQIGMDENEYFFLTSCREEKHGMRHVHFSIYPIKHEIVYFILVKLPEIKPQILSDVLEYLNNLNYDIFNSTGFCLQKDECYFGIYFSFSENLTDEAILNELKKFETILEVKIFKYTCIGCSEN